MCAGIYIEVCLDLCGILRYILTQKKKKKKSRLPGNNPCRTYSFFLSHSSKFNQMKDKSSLEFKDICPGLVPKSSEFVPFSFPTIRIAIYIYYRTLSHVWQWVTSLSCHNVHIDFFFKLMVLDTTYTLITNSECSKWSSI